MANPYLLNCDSRINDVFFEGDPGSIYVTFCPADCGKDVSVIHGNGVYDQSSPICKAAIHAGVLDERGGFTTVKIGWPHMNFVASTNMGITSMEMSWSAKGFFCTKTLNFHKKLSLEVYDVAELGLIAPFSRTPTNNLANNHDPVSFL